MTTTRTVARLSRLLNMVPFFIANPGMSKQDAAKEFGLSVKRLEQDLYQLFVCGLPGYGPGDLIDLHFDGHTVDVVFSAGIDRPVRLTAPEATALLVALSSLLDRPELSEKSAVLGAMAKIESAITASNKPSHLRSSTVASAPEPDAESAGPAALVRDAVTARRALRLVYYSASRDAVTERVVDPIQIRLIDTTSYLEAWCRSAESVRLFRLDRIEAATVLDEPARPQSGAQDRSALELFEGDSDLPVAVLRIAPEYSWMVEQYVTTVLGTDADGAVRASMRYATTDWMARLVLGFGGGVQVLEPAALARRVQHLAETAVAAYARSADLAAEVEAESGEM